MRIYKIISFVFDIFLVLIFGFVCYVQISILISQNSNHGVPKIFGKSILYVYSESMDDPDNPDSLSVGMGLIISSVSSTDIKPSTPIYDEDGILIDYEKDGDIVSFYCPDAGIVNTHRVAEKVFIESENKYYFITMGDNPVLHHRYLAEMWSEDFLIGKVTGYSRALGQFLEISNPSAANNLTYRSGELHIAWLFPVSMFIPAFMMGINHVVMYFLSLDKNEKDVNKTK